MFEENDPAQVIASAFSISEIASYIRLSAYGEAQISKEIAELEEISFVQRVELAEAREVTHAFVLAASIAMNFAEQEVLTTHSDEEKVAIIRDRLNFAERNAIQRTIWRGLQYMELEDVDGAIGEMYHYVFLKASQLTETEREALTRHE